MSATSINGLNPLARLSFQLTANRNVSLIEFESKDDIIKAKFTSPDPKELEKLGSHLKTSGLPGISVDYKKGKSRLSASFTGKM